MLKVNYEENRLTVVTPITKEMKDKAFGGMVLRDEKTDDILCQVAMSGSTEASMCSYGIYCNTIVDGCLAATFVLPVGTSLDDVKRLYGAKIVNLNKHIDKLEEQVKTDVEAVDTIFAE